MQYSYAIFDMDGTLVDSMGYWDKACSILFSSFTVLDEELFDILKPMTLGQTVDYLNDHFDLHITEEEMQSKVFDLMMGHYKNDVAMKPGADAFLDALQKRGVRMCVASSSPISMVEACLKHLGLDVYFDFLISAEEFGKGKTEPDIYWAAAERLGADRDQTIVFEDAFGAGKTAKEAGFSVAAIYDVHSDAEWDAFRSFADVAFADWKEAYASLSDQ